MTAGSAVPCSIHPRARPERGAGEVVREPGRPCQLRGGLERGAAASNSLALPGASPRPSSRSQRVASSGTPECSSARSARSKWRAGLLVGQGARARRAARRSSRRPWPPRRAGGRDEVVGQLAERRFGIAGVTALQDRADPAMQRHPARPRSATRRGSRESARARTCSAPERLVPPQRSVARAASSSASSTASPGRSARSSTTSIENDRPITAAIVTTRRAGGDNVASRRSIASQTPSGMPSSVKDARRRHAVPSPASGVDQVAQDLLDEERVALGVAVQRVREVRRRRAPEPRGDHRRDLPPMKAPEPHPLESPLAAQVRKRGSKRLGQVGVAVGAEDQHALRLDRAHEVRQQQRGRPVRPV